MASVQGKASASANARASASALLPVPVLMPMRVPVPFCNRVRDFARLTPWHLWSFKFLSVA